VRPHCFQGAHAESAQGNQSLAGYNFVFDDRTWIISDTHFFHENIGRYCDRPDGWLETIIEN